MPALSQGKPRYCVFLSYSHADSAWARWLMRRLEAFRVPKRLQRQAGPIGVIGPRIAPVFRDREEFPTGNDLGEAVHAALREAATLVVICSPAAAQSRWVGQEILEFKRLHGEGRVFPFVVAGEPKTEGGVADCFPLALRRRLGPDGNLLPLPAEYIAADARPEADGRTDAFVRLVAGLLGVGFDELRQRERHRRRRRFVWIATAVAGALALAALTWTARTDARRRQDQGERLLALMLGEQRAQLKRLGRLEVLEQYDAKVLAYLTSLHERDLSDTALARHAQALRQIGENRMELMRYAEAQEAFQSAYARAAALAARHPQNGDLLFERGQAEFWIGMVHRRRGEAGKMGAWWARYRDTGRALVRLDPQRDSWQGELAWGLHNMAAYDLDHGRVDEARRGFLAELEILTRLAAAAPADIGLKFRAVDANSWLGSIEERCGNFDESQRRFSQQVADLEAIIAADPGHLKWRANLAEALALRATVHAITGDRPLAIAARRRVAEIARALVASDPRNRAWHKTLLNSRVKEARLHWTEGNAGEAEAILAEALPELEQLVAGEPTDVAMTGALAAGCRLQAEARLATDLPAAQIGLNRAIELGERLIAKGTAKPDILGELTRAHLLAARTAAQSGNATAARRSAARARELIEPAAKDPTAHWQLADARARTLAQSGDTAAAAVVIEQLRRLGYVPLEPWPDPAK